MGCPTFSNTKLGNGLVPSLVFARQAIDETVCQLSLGCSLLSLSYGIVFVLSRLCNNKSLAVASADS